MSQCNVDLISGRVYSLWWRQSAAVAVWCHRCHRRRQREARTSHSSKHMKYRWFQTVISTPSVCSRSISDTQTYRTNTHHCVAIQFTFRVQAMLTRMVYVKCAAQANAAAATAARLIQPACARKVRALWWWWLAWLYRCSRVAWRWWC